MDGGDGNEGHLGVEAGLHYGCRGLGDRSRQYLGFSDARGPGWRRGVRGHLSPVHLFHLCSGDDCRARTGTRFRELSGGGVRARFRPGSKWWLVGALGVVSGVAIVSFYSVVGGWTLAYIGLAATNGLEGNLGERFGSVISKGGMNIGLTFAFIALAAASNVGGVRRGIERVTKILMPILIGLLLLLLRPQPHAARSFGRARLLLQS